MLSVLMFASQISLGIVFLFSALPKLWRPQVFVQRVAVYQILPAPFTSVFALMVILLEAVLAIAFLTGWGLDTALPLAVLLLLAFLVAVGINLRRGRKVPCGCFGDDKERISPRTLVRLFLLVAVVLLLGTLRQMGSIVLPSLPSIIIGEVSLVYMLQAVYLAALLSLLAAWLLSMPEVVRLARQLRWHRAASRSVDDEAEGVEGA